VLARDRVRRAIVKRQICDLVITLQLSEHVVRAYLPAFVQRVE
jgi:hypothetical protein